ncbi:type I DNA topoisomerase [Rarobacter incanus]
MIVESPAKARTISGYLGDEYEVEASVGHIRDLPQPSDLPADMKKGPFGKFAVDVENGFEPYYEVYADKKKKVRELKAALKDADELYLATDEDREGEAIAWHLLEALKPKVPVHRMVFHEITREAIERALGNTRSIDARLVDAQETRRILDRLYGYEVSPVLWRKVRQGLSAGRVQSVATRLVVERERERMAFISAGYWDLAGVFAPLTGPDAGHAFEARLLLLDGKKVATGRDFDDQGKLKNRDAIAMDEAAARALVAALEGRPAAVSSLETKPYTRKPAAPFTTSTLQQEASRKLRLSSRQTMRVAQSLYENGYITYMRTDSSALSTQAVNAARKQISELYGADYVPASPRVYAKQAKGAQEAHEAIRPAGDSFRTPQDVRGTLSGEEFRLYELIWKRTVASQMADARGNTATVRIEMETAAGGGQVATFGASGTVVTFPGFLAAYEESRDADRYSKAADSADKRLPQMAKGDALSADELSAEGHATTPPPRYTEASLVRALEERGIGRPSTYAATISVIQDRGYVTNRGQALVPSWLAFAVTRLLEEHFGQIVDYDFTAQMEADLDAIASGNEDRVAWLTKFYFGGDGEADRAGLHDLVADLGDIDAKDINSVMIGNDIRVRVGRYGPYLEDLSAPVKEGENPPRASIPDDIAPDELTVEKAKELLAAGADGGRILGIDPASGHEIVAKPGRFGPYVTEVLPEPVLEEGLSAAAKKRALAALPKPRTASLFKSQSIETMTLDDALQLLSLPRVVGTDPETGTEITAQNGRYGPYLKRGTDSRTIGSEEELFTITLEQALAIYAQPKRGRGGTSASAPLRELGQDPTSQKPIVIKDGRFGPYVTDGVTNRTLPRDATVESVTFDQAVELLAEKRAKGPAKRTARAPRRAGNSSAKKK